MKLAAATPTPTSPVWEIDPGLCHLYYDKGNAYQSRAFSQHLDALRVKPVAIDAREHPSKAQIEAMHRAIEARFPPVVHY